MSLNNQRFADWTSAQLRAWYKAQKSATSKRESVPLATPGDPQTSYSYQTSFPTSNKAL
jgi:hypothetical protein